MFELIMWSRSYPASLDVENVKRALKMLCLLGGSEILTMMSSNNNNKNFHLHRPNFGLCPSCSNSDGLVMYIIISLQQVSYTPSIFNSPDEWVQTAKLRKHS